jgi:S1-C subfamily serine protease
MKKLWSAFFLAISFFAFAQAALAASSTATFTDEELAALVKPAVVRVVQSDKGTSTIPAFDFNLNNLSLIPLPKEKPLVIPVDEELLGTGFVVNPDGYIITNSHVVSKKSVELDIIGGIIQEVLLQDIEALTPAQLNQINTHFEAMATSSDALTSLGEDLGKVAEAYILQNGIFDFSQTVTVLNPSSTPATLDTLLVDGFPATVVSVNDNFDVDQRDVALIKINEQNLPALLLGASSGLSIGQPLYTVGFPSTAQLAETDYLQSDFTDGVVSAIKSSDDGTFNIIQTNAKISTGSSGSPLVLGDGTVAGIITYESGQSDTASGGSGGDNFAGAIPIELAKSILASNGVSDQAGSYAPDVEQGLAMMAADHCKAAIADFDQAVSSTNPNFAAGSYVNDFISQCTAMIASGKSVDSSWDGFRASIGALGWMAWLFILIGIIVLGALIFFIVRLLHRSAHEEEQIATLTGLVHGSTTAAVPTNTNQPKSLPEIVEYARNARQAGVKDEDIVSQLGQKGCATEDIIQALDALK